MKATTTSSLATNSTRVRERQVALPIRWRAAHCLLTGTDLTFASIRPRHQHRRRERAAEVLLADVSYAHADDSVVVFERDGQVAFGDRDDEFPSIEYAFEERARDSRAFARIAACRVC